MIVVKTKMKKIPHACNKCKYYMYSWGIYEKYRYRICMITEEKVPMNYNSDKKQYEVGKADKCPLMEIDS